MNAAALRFWMPTRPFSIIDAINRIGLATGSMRGAMAGSAADYNGHRVTVDHRGHAVGGARWVAEHFWAGRFVHARGAGCEGFKDCVRAALREQARGALGAEVIVTCEDTPDMSAAEQAAFCASVGLSPYSDAARAAHDATWRDARFEEINTAFSLERQVGIPAVGFLANSATIEEYTAKCDAFVAERKARFAQPAAYECPSCGTRGRHERGTCTPAFCAWHKCEQV
jgi:uncharacterized protein YraI